MIENRFKKHDFDGSYAAFALDPIFSQKPEHEGHWMSAITTLEPEQMQRAINYMKRFVELSEYEALEAEMVRLKLEHFPSSMASLLPALTKQTVAGSKILTAKVVQRKNFWKVYGTAEGFPLTARCAVRLLSMHVTSAATERNWNVWGQLFTKYRANMALATAEKLVYIRGNSSVHSSPDELVALEL